MGFGTAQRGMAMLGRGMVLFKRVSCEAGCHGFARWAMAFATYKTEEENKNDIACYKWFM